MKDLLHEQDGTPILGGPIFEDGEWWVYIIFSPDSDEEMCLRLSVRGARYLAEVLVELAGKAEEKGKN